MARLSFLFGAQILVLPMAPNDLKTALGPPKMNMNFLAGQNLPV